MKKALVFLSVSLLFASCGGGGSSVSSLDKLPRMTNPVITNSASASSVKVSSASTGLKFWGTTDTAFGPGNSRGMCELFNLSRDSINRAATVDKMLCYIQNTIISDANKAEMEKSGINVYDGNTHIISLDFQGTNNNPNTANEAPKMKLKVVKDGDKIKEFEMFTCMGGTTAAPKQSEYIHEVIDGDNVTIVSKNSETSSESGTWKAHFGVTGKINADAQFIEKEITALTSYSFGSNSNAQKATFNQYADRFKVVGSQSGTYESNTYVNHVYSEFQLINGTSTDIHKLAMGDGSVKCSYEQGSSSPESWDGDTKDPLSSWTAGDYYSAVNAGTLPTKNPAAEAAAIKFETSETWDCSGTAEATMIVDQNALEATCSAISLVPDGGNSWIDCWGRIGY